MCRDDVDHLVDVEAAGGRQDLRGPPTEERQREQAGCMRQGGGVQQGVVRSDRGDVGEVRRSRRPQIGVAEPGALGAAGRAGRVEEPGVVGRRAEGERDRLGPAQVVVRAAYRLQRRRGVRRQRSG
jgi:hypothetical protein